MKRLLACFAVLALAIVLVRCGTSSSSPAAAGKYQGPGSHWTALMNADSTFTFSRAPAFGGTVDLTVSGTYVSTNSGFLHLTVTAATGSEAPAVGTKAYALNIPGFALLVWPNPEKSEIIPMLIDGSCPTGDLNLNWIQVLAHGHTDSATAEMFGTFRLPMGGAPALPYKGNLVNFGNIGAGTISSAGSCANGLLPVTGRNRDTVQMYLNAQGGAFVKGGDGVIVAMPQATVTAADLVGDYAGLVFTQDGRASNTIAFNATFTSNGTTATFTGNPITDENGTKDTTKGATFTLDSFNAISPGILTGTSKIKDPGLTGGESVALNVACEAAANVVGTNKRFLFCTSQGFQSSGTTLVNGYAFNYLMVSK